MNPESGPGKMVNGAATALSPLAVAMIERCSEIVSAHTPPEGVVLQDQLERFAGGFREKLRAGHCVRVRRGPAYTVHQVTLGEVALASSTVQNLDMDIVPPKAAQP